MTQVGPPIRLGPTVTASNPAAVGLHVGPSVDVPVLVSGGPGVQSYLHTQSVAAFTWTVRHNMHFNPAGFVIREFDGTLIYPASVDYPDVDTVVFTFSSPISGTVEVS